jgi:hypothetical protein
MDPHLDATAQADLVRAGEVSPRELVEASIARIEALNGDLNAVIHPLFEEALGTEPADGPFRGVPFVVKDLICSVAGAPHHEGMRFLRDLDFRADADSWLADRFRKAGFVFVGKTNTPELGILPRVAFRPTSPLHEAGIRIEPPPSLAWPIATMPDATAAPEPPLDPPVEREVSHGLRDGP